MKIDKISLYNFGSYEGKTTFDTKIKEGKNIILIGGKNGAGKTTLFTAMRLCLYGYMSMGYKNSNVFYNKAIIKLMNNAAKLKKPTIAFVELELSLNNGQTLDRYVLNRSWKLSDTISETFAVCKNGKSLSNEEINDFEKFILSLIPPELFNLYFFDGEKIADFFLEEGGNARIKNAFLTLCGYDTFEIMRKNFKRISSNHSKNHSLDDYVNAKECYELAKNERLITEEALENCRIEIDNCDSDIVSLEKEYGKKGGITQDIWDKKIQKLKEEEKRREGYNQILKKWANEKIPFIMVKDLLQDIKQQISIENDSLKFKCFLEILSNEDIINCFDLNNNLLELILNKAKEKYGKTDSQILDLSYEQSAALLFQLNSLLEFDSEKVIECKKIIKNSLKKSARIRNELERSNITSVQEYMQERTELYRKKSRLFEEFINLENELKEKYEQESRCETVLKKARTQLESEIKTESINNISAKAILMLDKLELILYRNQIEKVEEFFRKEISTLMRKTHFIDDIFIDDDFNIHIYRNEIVKFNDLKTAILSNTESQMVSLFGTAAIEKIKSISNTNDLSFAVKKLVRKKEELLLPIEIDKSSLSNGEKQILIMAIYHSLVQLCNYEIPFIIDTPFARIDTEHRQNISKYFFSKLNGQVFILSTNEEINSLHVQIMKDKILATYMLENTDNAKTKVISNTYFEV